MVGSNLRAQNIDSRHARLGRKYDRKTMCNNQIPPRAFPLPDVVGASRATAVQPQHSALRPAKTMSVMKNCHQGCSRQWRWSVAHGRRDRQRRMVAGVRRQRWRRGRRLETEWLQGAPQVSITRQLKNAWDGSYKHASFITEQLKMRRLNYREVTN